MSEQEKINVVPIGEGEAHLQNEIISQGICYICKRDVDEDCVLLRIEGKKMGFAHTYHNGVVQEFIRQYHGAPLGWLKVEKEDEDAGQSNGEKTQG
jgi:hypothetical protein